MKYALSRVDLGSVFKIAFVLYGVLGLFFAFLYSLFFLAISRIGTGLFGTGSEFFSVGARFGVVASFFLGIFFSLAYAALAATVVTALAALYNLLARTVGGVQLELSPAVMIEVPTGRFPEAPAPAPPLPQDRE